MDCEPAARSAVAIVKGETTVAQVAHQHGLTVGEIERWQDPFLVATVNFLRSRPKERPEGYPSQVEGGDLVLDFDILKRHFFDPMVVPDSRLRAILVHQGTEPVQSGLPEHYPVDKWSHVVIPEFKAEEIPNLIRELLRRLHPGKDTREVAEELSKLTSSPMSADEVHTLCRIYSKGRIK